MLQNALVDGIAIQSENEADESWSVKRGLSAPWASKFRIRSRLSSTATDGGTLNRPTHCEELSPDVEARRCSAEERTRTRYCSDVVVAELRQADQARAE